ncbi:MAG TPA: hypothetical protein PLA71_00415 [Saccharofermentans sp.]|nr:hypothetical protein [Saccharofermentans sp.]
MAGKGSKPRPTDMKKFRENWELIFGGKDTTPNIDHTYGNHPGLSYVYGVDYAKDFDPCAACPTDPKNGGGGICNCTLNTKTTVTC